VSIETRGSLMSAFDQDLGSFDPESPPRWTPSCGRQRDTLEMIASENFAPVAVLQARGRC